jgi:Tol biopolymer transport system component
MSRIVKSRFKSYICLTVIGSVIIALSTNTKAYEITQITFEPSYEGQPAWSPDGSKIAFVSDRDGNKEIYVMDANGSDQQRLTYNSSDDIEPDWSPDGSKIVFSSNRSGNYDVCIMGADGNQQVRLTRHSWDETAPAWRYNEDNILYHDPYWNGTIYIMNADGSGQTALANGRYPSWSSDGTKIVYSPGIRMMNPDGSGQAILLYGGGYEPAWSPNGNKIVFSIAKADITPDSLTYFPDLYMMDSDGSNLKRLTFDDYEYDFFSEGLQRRRPTWSPDGTKIAYHYKGDIWVMSGLPVLNADIQHDGIVNLRDFAVLADYWLQNDSSVNIAGDDVIDFSDLAKLAEEWLQMEPWYRP